MRLFSERKGGVCIIRSFFLLFFFIKVWFIYSLVSISAVGMVTQSYVSIDIHFLLLSSIVFYPKRVDIVPCAVQ